MATDDISLRVGLERLEIEPIKVKNVKEENPFSNSSQKKTSPKAYTQSTKCNCIEKIQKKKNISIYKRKNNKLLRDPVLRLHGNGNLINECQQLFKTDNISPTGATHKLHADNLCLHTLVDNCNQLSISTKENQILKKNESNSSVKWWKCETSNERQPRDLPVERSSSCSQQALNPPCDITIDELASYFETLVHIPKKMSSMAEMMYI